MSDSAGLAERAAQLIKRAQTSHTLWAHELSRVLHPPSSSSSTRRTGPTVRDVPQLLLDANPALRLEVLAVHSRKPASLALAGTEGGFITGGAAEKLLLCTCRIISSGGSEEESQSQSQAEEAVDFGGGGGGGRAEGREAGTSAQGQGEKEGLVLFSLACHPKSAAATQLARPGQQQPQKKGAGTMKDETEDHAAEKTQTAKLQFAPKNRTLLLPGNVGDLHSALGEGDEVWAWDPCSVVDLPGDVYVGQTGGEKVGSKALLVSRFAVLQ